MAKDMTVPKVYKGKKTMEMTGPEYEKMLKELGMDKPSKTAKKGDFNEEPDMGSAKKMAKGGAVKKTIKEYGGKEKYASKAAMMKHEKKEGPAKEKKEKMMAKGGAAKKGPSIMIAIAIPKKAPAKKKK